MGTRRVAALRLPSSASSHTRLSLDSGFLASGTNRNSRLTRESEIPRLVGCPTRPSLSARAVSGPRATAFTARSAPTPLSREWSTLSLDFGLTPEVMAETEADWKTNSRSARAAIAALSRARRARRLRNDARDRPPPTRRPEILAQPNVMHRSRTTRGSRTRLRGVGNAPTPRSRAGRRNAKTSRHTPPVRAHPCGGVCRRASPRPARPTHEVTGPARTRAGRSSPPVSATRGRSSLPPAGG